LGLAPGLRSRAAKTVTVGRSRTPHRGAPDRAQQWRDSLRAVLQAGFGEGAQLLRRGGPRPANSCTRSAKRKRHSARPLRQVGCRDQQARVFSPWSNSNVRGAANGLKGIERLSAKQMHEIETARERRLRRFACLKNRHRELQARFRSVRPEDHRSRRGSVRTDTKFLSLQRVSKTRLSRRPQWA